MFFAHPKMQGNRTTGLRMHTDVGDNAGAHPHYGCRAGARQRKTVKRLTNRIGKSPDASNIVSRGFSYSSQYSDS